MLKRILVQDLVLGMYVHAVDVPLLAKPFWRSNILLTSLDQIQELSRSKIPAVIVDLDRSVMHAEPSSAPGLRRGGSDRFSAERRAEDFRVAKRVTEDARRITKNIYDVVRDSDRADCSGLDAVIGSIAQSLGRNRSMLLGIMRLKSRDTYTYSHSVAVCTLMVNFAHELGLPDDEARLMGLGGLFHDIGKTKISNQILDKPGRLTQEEFEEIRQHPVHGHRILLASDAPPIALDVCLHHHEKIDGSGYPYGLSADEISLAARMGAICDVYDALTSERPYKDAYSPVAAVAAMVSWQGHLDIKLLFVFMKSIGVFPVGMLIQLRSGHLAVARDNGRRASRARLAIFYDTENQGFITPHELFLSDINVSELIVDMPDPAAFGFDDWPDLQRRLLSGFDPSVRKDARVRGAGSR